MHFEAKKSALGTWIVWFGPLKVKALSSKTLAERRVKRLQGDPKAVDLATQIAAKVTEGTKVWHLAAGAEIDEKGGEPRDRQRGDVSVNALGKALWMLARGRDEVS